MSDVILYFANSFNGGLCDECLDVHQFASLADAQASSMHGWWIRVTTVPTAHSDTRHRMSLLLNGRKNLLPLRSSALV